MEEQSLAVMAECMTAAVLAPEARAVWPQLPGPTEVLV